MSNLPPAAEPTTDASGRKVWKVGTLTYTAGGLVALFALLLWGDFASSMKDRSVTQVFQLLLYKFGASNFLMNLIIISIGATITLGLAPYVAYKSDRHRGRWGRRIPFLLLSTPFVSLALVGVGFSPMLGTKMHELLSPNGPSLNTCILSTLTFFWVLFDFASVIGGAVFNGLVNDVVPRAVMGRFFAFWRAISLVCAIIFNHYIMGSASTHYLEIYIGMAVLFGLGFGFMCLRLKEGEYPPPPPPPPHGALGAFYAVKGYFQECFTIPYYWLLFAAGLFAGYTATPINNFCLPFAKSLNISDQAYGDYQSISYIVSLTLAYPLGWLVDKTHPLPLSLGALALYTVTMFFGGFVAGDPRYFGYVFIAHVVLSGTFFTVNASLALRLLPRATFAQFAAAGGMIVSIWNIFVAPYLGHVLDILHSDYHYTYFMSAGFGVVGSILYAFLYIQFLKHGGYKNYVAPDNPPA